MKKLKNEIKTSRLFPNAVMSLLTAVVLLFGAASCGSEGQEADTGEDIEEGLGYEDIETPLEVTNREVEEGFERWDTDENQRLSREEFESAANSVGLYSAWNNNEDDVLTASELGEGIFNIYDEDNDNMLDMEEFTAWNEDWGRDFADSWDAWDADNDNMLSATEFATGFSESGVFDKWDTVDDNVYTKEEVYNALFAALDEGGDGYLTEEEYRKISDYMGTI